MNFNEDIKQPQEPRHTDPKHQEPKPEPKKPAPKHIEPKPKPQHHKMSYTIVSGDTFWSIAQAHGTTVAAIEAGKSYCRSVFLALVRLLFGLQDMLWEQSTPKTGRTTQFTS